MPLSATIEKLPAAIAVVTLQGPMTLGSSLKLIDSQINAVIAEGVSKMVIDLTGVDYVDSAGLGMLMYTYGTLNGKNGSLRLCGVARAFSPCSSSLKPMPSSPSTPPAPKAWPRCRSRERAKQLRRISSKELESFSSHSDEP